jgi:PKD repeat protein
LGWQTGRLFVPGILLAASLVPVNQSVAESTARIKNPFYATPQWRLWHLDQQPVQVGDKELAPLPPQSRTIPVDPGPSAPAERFLVYRKGGSAGQKYAGFWDDVYASADGRHSFMPREWSDAYGNSAKLGGQHMELVISPEIRSLAKLGLTFTSQSTTGMGHDLTDSYAEIDNLERYFCFANTLRAGPAHVSYTEYQLERISDKYDAIVPCFFNSVGSSSSEVNALAKMMIAGGYLPTATKYRLKENGLYIPALLYIWKASLPYDVPYSNELRHRVAYAASGRIDDPRLPLTVEVNHTYHRYDESQHLRNMVDLAKSMDTPPPFAVFQSAIINGGSIGSINKSAIRVHQGPGETIRMTVSARESFDLQGRPLSFNWDLLYGNTTAIIEPSENGEVAVITVPFDARLPTGRTVVMLTVNNGRYDSNPAMINVFRGEGQDNRRPSLSGLSDVAVLSGESVHFSIHSEDPEGQPTALYRWANEVGDIDGTSFLWKTPQTKTLITEPVSVIATDGTSGFNSKQVMVTVTPTLAVLTADKTEGQIPLEVNFSAEGSRDSGGQNLVYSWDFDDGHSSSDKNPLHVFESPGFHEVTLTVRGPSGQHTVSQFILAEPNWGIALENGWKNDGIDPSVWSITGPVDISLKRNSNDRQSLTFNSEKGVPRDSPISFTSVESFSPPFSVSATFKRSLRQRGAGIEILGNLIGYLEGRLSPDTSIGHQNADWTWTYQPIARRLSRPDTPSRLLVYVTPDPDHPGRIRYTGRLQTPLETRYFSFDDQVLLGDKVRLLAKSGNGRFEISEFVVRRGP